MPTPATAERAPPRDGMPMAPQARNFTLARAALPANDAEAKPTVPGLDREARTLELTFSSEAEVPMWFGTEVLSHDADAADLSRLNDGGALLWGHDTRQMASLIGVVERAWVGPDRRGHAVVRFARTATGDQALEMVADGVLRNVSFMYHVEKYVIETDKDDPYYDPDAVYTATRWTAYEISLLSVPADQSIGVARQAAPDERSVSVEIRSTRAASQPQPQAPAAQGNTTATQEEEGDMKFRRTTVCQAADVVTSTGGTPTPPATNDPARAERERAAAIVALGRKHDIPMDVVHSMIERGLDIAAARGEVLDGILERSQKPVADFGESYQPDMTNKEKKRYSFLRALQAHVNKDWTKAGFEREVSQAIAKRMGKDTEGFFLPNDLPFAPDAEHQRAWQMMSQQGKTHLRAPYQVGTPATGGNLVATELHYENFIEVLRNQLVTAVLGARYLTGLVGNIDIPRQISQSGASWVGESAAPGETEATFDKVSLRPKTISALSKMSRLMLLQATPAIEMLARQDLLAVIALAMDLAALSGSGAGNAPTGIVNQAGVASVIGGANGANLSFDHLIQLKYATRFANAPQGATGYALNSKAIGYLSTLKATTGQYLWDPQGGLTAGSPDKVKGSPYAESQQLRSTLTKGTSAGLCSEAIYGNWQELFIAMWGVTEVMLNPYDSAGFANGDVLLRAMQTCDVGVRHGASFAVMSDALTPGF